MGLVLILSQAKNLCLVPMHLNLNTLRRDSVINKATVQSESHCIGYPVTGKWELPFALETSKLQLE